MVRSRILSLLLPLALAAVAAAMVWCASWQADEARQAAERADVATRLMTGVLDQETGVRGFLLNGEETYLSPFRLGHTVATDARAELLRTADGEQRTIRLIRDHEARHDRWHALALRQIAMKREAASYRGDPSEAFRRKVIMDDLRALNDRLHAEVERRREVDTARVSRISNVLILTLMALVGAAAALVLRHESRRRQDAHDVQHEYRASQREFTDIIQVVGSEREAHTYLKRHLEMQLPDATATVLTRNNSDNRLEAATEIDETSPLVERLTSAEPSACLAVRLARSHRAEGEGQRLLECAVCGKTGVAAACEPLLVSGQVIGAVLVQHHRPLHEDQELRIRDSVSQAAPVLANLRNLALAERRASTDALTGLPNRRAVQDTLKRMVAQAARNMQPLTAIAIDLDRFKDINDRFGHDMGDTVLAQVSAVLLANLRTSDFCGRLGGEEFLVLAPNTALDGAQTLAENLRGAFEREAIAGLDRDVTGSFGIAVLPDHAATGDALLRLSDRALYAAKAGGRNRVAVADGPAETARAESAAGQEPVST